MANPIRCDQCAACMIQGVLCHETGCVNTYSRYDAESGEWIKRRKCFECGCTVDADESCCEEEDGFDEHEDTQDEIDELYDEEEHEDTDSLEDHGITLGSYAS